MIKHYLFTESVEPTDPRLPRLNYDEEHVIDNCARQTYLYITQQAARVFGSQHSTPDCDLYVQVMSPEVMHTLAVVGRELGWISDNCPIETGDIEMYAKKYLFGKFIRKHTV